MSVRQILAVAALILAALGLFVAGPFLPVAVICLAFALLVR